MKAKCLLIIFTRNPELGKVKTRLAKEVGDSAALAIYKFLLQHTLDITKELAVEKHVYYSGYIPQTDIWDGPGFTKKLQQGQDLGERMQQAFEAGFKQGFEKIAIIGSDLFDLSARDLERAFDKLNSHEFVLGPAQDGGYYLLGMTQLLPGLFRNKMWGTSSVLASTLEDLKNQKFTLLDERNDVDYFKDIKDHEAFQQFL